MKYENTMCIYGNGDRNALRMQVINEFSKELPGTGKGPFATNYTYFVETLLDGNRIFLKRPAPLHNGFDFVINVENYNFNLDSTSKYRCYPRHEEILFILKSLRSSPYYDFLFLIIETVYKCYEVKTEELQHLNNYFQESLDYIPKVLKWIFIEQDIRYWNYSGRAMLWKGICEIN